MKEILEFNEDQQLFHFNTIKNGQSVNPENTNGYKTLMFCKDSDEAILFSDFLDVQYRIPGRKVSFNDCKRTIENLQKFISRYREINKI